MNSDLILQITVAAIPLILAITLHEAAHAFAARYFGDSTAYMMGRMTLNPAKHIDPIWTIVVPLFTWWYFHFPIGAAKPVPVNFDGLRNPRRDSIWVAAAGPFANLLMMLAWAIGLRFLQFAGDSTPSYFLRSVAAAGVSLNALIMIFNLFPLLPLDGGRILAGLLPPKMAYSFSKIEPFGFILLLPLLMLTPLFERLILPLAQTSANAVYWLIGLS